MSTLIHEDQYVKIGSINTCYWSMGTQGSTVLLLHGLGGYKETWRENIWSLAASHQVYAVDLVGFGLTDKPAAAYSLSYFTQFIYDFMDELNIARASLIGNSLGGVIALNYALYHPDRVDKLVLVDGVPGKAVHPMLRLITLPLLGEMLRGQGKRNARRVAESCFYNLQLITDDFIDLYCARSALPGAHAAFLSTARALFDLTGVRDSVLRPIAAGLHTLTAPTLIIWGEEDRVLSLSHAKAAKAEIPNAELLVFEQCGHVPQLERPEKFNAAVLEFLAK